MGLSNAERQRRYIARLKARAQPGSSDDDKARIAELEAELRAEREASLGQAQAFCDEMKRRGAKPKTGMPVPPDEERERRIKALTTRVRNLRGELAAAYAQGAMSRATYVLIAKCLHPDQRDNASAAERNEAAARFIGWYDGGKKKRAGR